MKVSYNELQKFFDGKLPSVPEVIEAFTFHAWEIEEVEEVAGDTVIDVKVLPDKSSWALSYRGIAKDLSVVLNVPLLEDPFMLPVSLESKTDSLSVRIEAPECTRYTASIIEGIQVKPSPEWLRRTLESVGQRSINNIVDATNYIMFRLGQPLHAFDAHKLAGMSISVRKAREGEAITTLSNEERILTEHDMVIVDGVSDLPIGIAGVKGGIHAAIDDRTHTIILESAHFDAVTVRKTAQRLKLRTDASKRFENGIVSDITAYALKEVTELIMQIAGGTHLGYVDTGAVERKIIPVDVSFAKVNAVLGLTLSHDQITKLIERFGYAYVLYDDTITVTPPFERTDLTIPEDFIEEIGRVHGYDHVPSIAPERSVVPEINKTFYYTNKIRTALIALGFSEVLTSSFHEKDQVALKNAFAADKGYLRSTLVKNMEEVLERNAPLVDLLGVDAIRTFEIGTVFKAEGETLCIAIGVRGSSGYKEKVHAAVVTAAQDAVTSVFGSPLAWEGTQGVMEAKLTDALVASPVPSAYDSFTPRAPVTYASYSAYPFISRDIALWVPLGTDAAQIETFIREQAGELLVRLTLFDEFKKEDRVSYAFRLVFQSHERTLTDEEVGMVMKDIEEALKDKGFEIR